MSTQVKDLSLRWCDLLIDNCLYGAPDRASPYRAESRAFCQIIKHYNVLLTI